MVLIAPSGRLAGFTFAGLLSYVAGAFGKGQQMSLFVDPNGTGDATTDLFAISSSDGNFNGGPPVTATIKTNIGNVTATQLTYPSVTTGTATANRLSTLINTTTGLSWGNPILITPLNGGNDPYGVAGNLTGNGATYVDSSVTPSVIHVLYDTSQCSGQGMQVFDTSGNAIPDPGPVVLYHELSHAFHNAINQNPFPQTACPGNTSDEPAAEIDENVMRTELGIALRDPCNHGGQCGGGSSGGGCFIVSAATQSTESGEIHRLRQLRQRVIAKSALGAQLIERVYNEYYQFSPAIAAQVQQDDMARIATLGIVVRPLLAWYTLAGALALPEAGQNVVRNAVDEILNACLNSPIRPSISSMLDAIRSGAPLPEGAPEMILSFEPRLRQAAKLPYASWAILDPLVRMWSLDTGNPDLAHEVSQWLAAAPIETLKRPAKVVELEAQLAILATFFDFEPNARRQAGSRLAEAWPEVTAALQRYGFQ
jgi:hypothetical protein